MKAEIEMWVIYFNPADYPGRFVVRRHSVFDGEAHPSQHCILADDLDHARDYVPGNCINLGRLQGDDPAIFEVWF